MIGTGCHPSRLAALAGDGGTFPGEAMAAFRRRRDGRHVVEHAASVVGDERGLAVQQLGRPLHHGPVGHRDRLVEDDRDLANRDADQMADAIGNR